MIYLDSSAIVKLLREEAESAALHDSLAAEDAPPVFTSQLAITEVKRALHAAHASDTAATVSTSEPPSIRVPGQRIAALPITIEIVTAAGNLLADTSIRSLDAIHVATARQAEDLDALITYDDRMIAAAVGVGLPVSAPGRG